MKRRYRELLLTVLLFICVELFANNVIVGTPIIASVNTIDDYAMVEFDLSWENSFRDDINWDAVWVFVKYQPTGGSWSHASVHTTDGNHTIPSGYTCSVGETDGSGMGVFIYRDANGSGNTNLSDVAVRWQYGADGLADNATFLIKVFAIEMVNVPEGAYSLGSGGDESGHFFKHDGTGSPDMATTYTVTSDDAIVVGTAADNLWGASTEGSNKIGPAGTLSAAFPKAYKGFYCMKYEMSQGQYADFLNCVTTTQDGNLYPNAYNWKRNTIGGSAGIRSADVPDRACNYITWMDGCSYADWAGLRPMTEFEFEKACRGSVGPVTGEYAWGNTNIAEVTYVFTNDGLANSAVTNTVAGPTGNFFCGVTNTIPPDDHTFDGPIRCGIFASSTSSRTEAGATYYGIMEMCGNLWERTVSIANIEGRAFSGTHGDGVISTNGYATNSDWPGYISGEVTEAQGANFRGGSFSSVTLTVEHRVSSRRYSDSNYLNRNYSDGIRLVRTVE
ncbi:SUMF1/EgtB/PvdO family nonheme iron enzyme [bacterium]|nr:SUMF1/EgtB/PvdO family nonheme iron enzyme [bacterium]